jgi:hypothetical protein
MKFVKREFPDAYKGTPPQDHRIERSKEIAGTSSRAVAKRIVGNEFSLVAIDKEFYLE